MSEVASEPLEAAVDVRTYLYGIVRQSHPADLSGLAGVGASGSLRVIEAGDLRVIADDVTEDLRAKRRDLAAHTGVLDHLSAQGATLPLRFGTLAENDEAVAREVVARQDRLAELLTELESRVEMYLKVAHHEDAVLRAVLAEDDGLRAMNDDLRERGGEHGERVHFGELVAAAVAERERVDTEAVVAALAPRAVRHILGPALEGCFLTASFLVDRNDVAAFESAVEALRESISEVADVRLHGPLPPYSFAGEPELS